MPGPVPAKYRLGPVPTAHRPSLAPPPEAQWTALDDDGVLRDMRLRIGALIVGSALLVALSAALISGPVRADWALASGAAKIVKASVVGSQNVQNDHRACTMTQVNVVWPASGGGNRGHFTVCDNAASRFRVGAVVRVAATRGDTSVLQGERRGDAILAVLADMVVLLLGLLILGGLAVRRWLTLGAAGRRWRTAPWLPGDLRLGTRPGRLHSVVIFFDQAAAPWAPAQQPSWPRREDLPAGLEFRIQPRDDDQRLADGDPVWLVPTGSSLIGRRRIAPYAVVRMTDRRVFWGKAKPMPGTGW